MANFNVNFVLELIKQEDCSILKKDISKALNFDSSVLSKMIKANRNFTNAQIELLRTKFNLRLDGLHTDETRRIDYLNIPKLNHLIKNPKIPYVMLDINLAVNVWEKDVEKLKLCKNSGSLMMNANEIHINNDEVLLIDTSVDSYRGAGLYCFTTRDDNQLYNIGIARKPNGDYMLYCWNRTFEPITYTKEQWDKLNVKIYGQIIKNMSLGTYTKC